MQRRHLAPAALLALALTPAAASADTAPTGPDAVVAHDYGSRVHIASGLTDGRHDYSYKGQTVVVEGPRTFEEAGSATVEIYRGKKRAAVVRGKLRGEVGAKGGFRVKFHARRLGLYRLRVTIRRDTETEDQGRRARLAVRVVAPTAHLGSRGLKVRLLQRGLARLHYVTSRGGSFDDATARAVLAFRKVNGMSRTTSATRGVYRKLFAGEGGFRLKYPKAGKHVEFDWSRQVLVLARGGQPERIYHASSGKPSTPTVFGTFHFYSKTPGTNAKGMVFSSYFIRGYAIHGYVDVPPYAASHGCIRVPIPNAVSIYDWISLGDTIFVYR
jgi:hypothetical protein